MKENQAGEASLFKRVVRAALAVMLASGTCIPSFPAYAESESFVAPDAAFVVRPASQEAGIDLNAAWEAQENGLEGAYTVTEGGTYYLSADLETKENAEVTDKGLKVNAPGEDVVIKFNGHALTLTGSGSPHQTMVSIVAAKSVTFDGSSDAGTSRLESAGETDVWAISSTASGCAVSANDLTVTLKSKSDQQRDLATHAVRITAGSLDLTSCTVQMLMGNQALRSTDLLNETDSFEVPSAIYATSGVSSVTLTDCAVTGEGPMGFSPSDLKSTTTIGNAYAVYSQARETAVRGGSYKAVSLIGNATCLFGRNLTIASGPAGSRVSLEADAGGLATGILSTVAGGVTLDAPVTFAPGADFVDYARVEAALRSSVGGGFVFGSHTPSAGSYPALVMTSTDTFESANGDGYVIGTFASGVSPAQQQAIIAALGNALGDQGACDIDYNAALGVRFSFSNPGKAAAKITRSGSDVFYPTMSSAIGALANGDTLTLLKDAGDVVISKVNDATVDLGGKAVNSFEFSTTTSGGGLVVRNGRIEGTKSVNGLQIALHHKSPSPLVLESMEIAAKATDASLYGIYAESAAGAISVDSSSISLTAMRISSAMNAYGIYVNYSESDGSATAPSLSLDQSDVSVRTASAGVEVCGVFSPVSTEIRGGKMSAVGATASAGALQVGGVLDASDAAFSVAVSGSPTIAYAVWGISSPAASSLAFDSCDFSVDTAAGETGPYCACLIGPTTELGISRASWSLSGQCSFASTSGLHIGPRFGTVSLSDFKLKAGSDQEIVVSQSKQLCADDAGFSVSGTPSASQMQSYGWFVAQPKSEYGGKVLTADNSGQRLIWSAKADGSGVVQVQGTGAGAGLYSDLASAVAHAQAGDSVKLLEDLEVAGVQVIDKALDIDLNGKELVVRAGRTATSGALRYTDSASGSSLVLRNGTLTAYIGSSTVELDNTYQGLALTGGGTLTVAQDAKVNVVYEGAALTSSQREVEVRGVAVSSGRFVNKGVVDVSVAAADKTFAKLVYGVYAQATKANLTSKVEIADNATVSVHNSSDALTTENPFYAEQVGGSGLSLNSSPTLREITIDPAVDADFYDAVVKQFRVSAKYDDPSTATSSSNTFGAMIYYAQSMVLDCDGAWYDGLKLWAYSDEVDPGDVGKKSAIVPTHVFVSTPYDALPNAYGVATSGSSRGAVDVKVGGSSVEATCEHGNAYALYAASSSSATTTWTTAGPSLTANADDEVHVQSAGAFDLRDFITFKNSTQSNRVVYTKGMKVSAFAAASARDVYIDESVKSFTLDGVHALALSGGDRAAIESDSFKVGGSFALSGGEACTVASSGDAYSKGAVFASGAANAALFADAYGTYRPAAVSGGVAWSGKAGSTVTFKVGDAVVKRYADPVGDIDLSEPSASAGRVGDLRQTYSLVGWSTSADENATTGFLPPNGTLAPSGSATYYAVYSTQLVSTAVTFSNVHDSSGALKDTSSYVGRAAYGQTVGDAVSSFPVPEDYSGDGIDYRFAGWYPYLSSSETGPMLYSSDAVKELEVTLSLYGVSRGEVDLRAVYVAVEPGQHLVSFDVDGRTSVCVVDDGARPVYTDADNTNTNYVVPDKIDTESDKDFTFDSWVDAYDLAKSYPSILPVAHGDASYKAKFSWEYKDLQLSFHYKVVDASSGKVADATKVVYTTCSEKTQDVADALVKVGSQIGSGGKIYTLKGWSIRSSDVDPVYDADNSLPSVQGDDRALSSARAQTFYAVYGVSDHKVKVSFYDGSTKLGQVSTLAISTSVSKAFSMTKAKTPADKSEAKAFMGWATTATATRELPGASTMIEDLAGGTEASLELFAVYGKLPTYTVRLRSADGKKTLYTVPVKRGRTVSSVLAANKVTVKADLSEGKYFAGWYTVAGKFYSLDTEASGSANLNAKYRDITVSSPDKGKVTAAVTPSAQLTSLGLVDELSSLTLSFAQQSTADSLLGDIMKKNGYKLVSCYTMKLVAKYASGKSSIQTGTFGKATVKAFVGTQYKNSKVRIFWIGKNQGSEVPRYTDALSVDDGGYVTMALSDYALGDESLGGNFSVAYYDGGVSDSSLSRGDGSIGMPGDSGDSGVSTDGGSGSVSDTNSDGSLSSSSLSGGAGLLASGLSGVRQSTSGGSGSRGGTGSGSAASGGSSGKSDNGAAGGDSADSGAEGSAAGEDETTFFSDWDSNAIVLVVLVAIALGSMAYGLWRLIVARQRRSEDEAELPVMADRYAKGIQF